MKKKLLVMLVAVMCIMLCACGSSEGNNTESNTGNSQVNTENSQSDTDTTQNESVKLPIVGKWAELYITYADYKESGIVISSGYPGIYVFEEDGTFYSDTTGGDSYKFKYEIDSNKNVVIINYTDDYSVELAIIEENGAYRLNYKDANKDTILIPYDEYNALSNSESSNDSEDINNSNNAEETKMLPSVDEILADSKVEPLELFYLIQHGMSEYSSVSVQGKQWGDDYSFNYTFAETDREVHNEVEKYIYDNWFIYTSLCSAYEIVDYKNISISKGICPENNRECYTLSLITQSETVEICDTKLYVDAETYQIVYVERTASDSGYLYGASKTNKSFNTSFTYNK